MRKLWILLCLLLLPALSNAALLNVDTTYRITEVKADERVFGIALMSDDPDVTQNDVYFEADSKCYREMRFSNGTRKEIPVTIEKFFKLIKRGDVVKVKGGRDWDGSIRVYSVRLQTYVR